MTMRVIALALAAFAAQQAAPPAAPVVSRLTRDVVAVGRAGAPVVDLRPEEIEVWISGYRVPVDDVAFITPETAPRTVVLLLDNVAVGPELAIRVRETARAFVKQLGERDRVSVGPVEGPQIDGTGEPARLLRPSRNITRRDFRCASKMPASTCSGCWPRPRSR